MIYYKALVGSQSYGLALDKSDIDILIVSDKGRTNIYNRQHTIYYTPSAFLNLIPLPKSNVLPYHIQWLFPGEADNSPLYNLVLEHREPLVFADRKRVYEAYLAKSEGLSYQLENLYETFPKRGAYACFFLDTVYRYAEGATFFQASRPEEDFRQWLLAVRRHEIDTKELAERYWALRGKAEQVSDFYQAEPDIAYIAAVEQEMRKALGIKI